MLLFEHAAWGVTEEYWVPAQLAILAVTSISILLAAYICGYLHGRKSRIK